MVSEGLILGFDTSAAHCAAALLSGDRVLACRTEDMGRGQAERLMPLLQEVLSEGGATWAELMRIGVGIGPGNFTGIRISVSAARGLALALDIPAIGISTFDVIDRLNGPDCVAVVHAPRDQAYIRVPGGTPELTPLAEAEASGFAPAFAPSPDILAQNIARLAATAPTNGQAPAPLYIRPADAAPARDLPPVILADDA
ncbi:tRNA (adenosine(37)-N6)-threonylcarbamoyltransferase complex dimerization subunit type 1 TsaB [uncultured Roseovarius sp.]|uniref:tRNA (adenosine(37)-N6)-threonylcarbamoyltransferase complex dimerization subunit type 1 TsaB n=1 Tax=Roseovarius sp. TaxID=1486281 RepID=UPI0025E3F051|nr:tRNA (adenosine(37)-N6)-threonylcarbamoyltransferase complex dimerization subunit type 1 TsaB [uncultured Roseovarius sp.]